MPTFSAPVDQIRATSCRLEAASRALRRLCDHPGRVGGLAQDGGDPAFRDAAVELARRWRWSLDGLADGTSRWAALLGVVAEQYAETERLQIRALGPPRVLTSCRRYAPPVWR